MAWRCELTGKTRQIGHRVSHSNRKTKRRFLPNLLNVTLMLAAYLPPALVVVAAFFGTNWIAVHDLKPAQMHRSQGDNWYDYPHSYWNDRQGIDRGEKSAGVYSLHVLVGHHGIFVMLIWLLSLLGIGLWLFGGDRRLRLYAFGALGITLVCLAFYLWWPGVDRNYGGTASGFRWVFWMRRCGLC